MEHCAGLASQGLAVPMGLLSSMKLVKRNGQHTLEFALVSAGVVAALLAMQVYIKRGIAGSFRSSADSIGLQYAPRKTTSTLTTQMNGTTTTRTTLIKQPTIDVIETKTIIDPGNPETTTRTGHETVEPLETNLWDP